MLDMSQHKQVCSASQSTWCQYKYQMLYFQLFSWIKIACAGLFLHSHLVPSIISISFCENNCPPQKEQSGWPQSPRAWHVSPQGEPFGRVLPWGSQLPDKSDTSYIYIYKHFPQGRPSPTSGDTPLQAEWAGFPSHIGNYTWQCTKRQLYTCPSK